MMRLVVLTSLISACGSNPTGTDSPDASTTEADAASDVDASTTPDGPMTCAATESCDGVIDDNCDGGVDEGCGRCPLLAISCVTGCCPVDRWEVATANATGASIAVDSVGNIFFAYTVPSSGPWTAHLAIYDAVPGTWRTIPLGGGGYRNRVIVDAMDHVHTLNAGNGSSLQYRRSDDHGVTFSAPVTVGILNLGDLFDMKIDTTGAPHVAYNGDRVATSFGDLRYTHLVGTTWTSTTLDDATTAPDNPTLELGFANRPHIVTNAYTPGGVAGYAKRYTFHNGNRWITENADEFASGATYTGFDYFSAQSLRVDGSDARELLFSRQDSGSADTLYLARRGAADLDTWQVTPITGVSSFTTPTMFVDAHGKRGAVSDGLTLHREGTGTAWTSTPIGVPGLNVAVARRGRYLYLGFSGGTLSGPPTVTVVDLGP